MTRHRAPTSLPWLPRLTRVQTAALALTAAGAATVLVAPVVDSSDPPGQPTSIAEPTRDDRGGLTPTPTTTAPPTATTQTITMPTPTPVSAGAAERSSTRACRCDPRSADAATTPPTTTAAEPTGDVQPQTTATAQLLELVNRDRAAHGCAPVALHPDLTAQSQAHAEQQAAADRMHHSDGPTGFDTWGENVAVGYDTAAEVHDAWMASPGHRANVLTCEFTHMGAGAADAADGTRYWTEQFAA